MISNVLILRSKLVAVRKIFWYEDILLTATNFGWPYRCVIFVDTPDPRFCIVTLFHTADVSNRQLILSLLSQSWRWSWSSTPTDQLVIQFWSVPNVSLFAHVRLFVEPTGVIQDLYNVNLVSMPCATINDVSLCTEFNVTVRLDISLVHLRGRFFHNIHFRLWNSSIEFYCT